MNRHKCEMCGGTGLLNNSKCHYCEGYGAIWQEYESMFQR